MSEPLKYKVEKAMSAWLAADTALSAFTHYIGQNPDPQSPPAIVVYASSIQESFPDSMPKNVAITVEIVTAIDPDANSDAIAGKSADRTANWATHRAAVAAVEARMMQIETAQQFCGTANRTNRPVSDFYLYDIQEDSQQSTFSGEDRMLISVIGYTVVCEAQNN